MKAPENPTSVAKKLILLVDDHPIFRDGIEAFLKKHQPELTCVHSDSPSAALQSIRDSPPDVVIIDVSLGGRRIIQQKTRMKAVPPSVVVIVFSMHDDSSNVLRAVKAGAQACVRNTHPPRQLT